MRVLTLGGHETDVPESSNQLVSLTFDDALNIAILAMANVVRALRQMPPVTRLDDLHHAMAARYRASVLEAVLAQHPAAVLEALNDAGDELFEVVNMAMTEPEAAIVNDDERLKEACRAWFKRATDTYRGSLAAQLAILRSAEQLSHGDSAGNRATRPVEPSDSIAPQH